MAWQYILLLEHDNAINWVKSALRLDPVSSDTVTTAAQIYILAGRFTEGYDQAQYALSLEKNNLYAMHMKALATGYQGDWKTAVDELEIIVNRLPHITHVLVSLGIAYSYDNRKEETWKIIEKLENMQATQNRDLSYELTMLYLHVDDMEKFHHYFLKSVLVRNTGCMVRYGTPLMKHIRNDEVLIKARQETGLPA